MRVSIFASADDAAARTAAIIAGEIASLAAPAAIAFPTGRTPVAVYDRLASRVAEGGLSFGRVLPFMLDEYAGLPPDHPASFNTFLRRHLFDRVGIAPGAEGLIRGDAADPEAEALRYEAEIARAGGFALCFLGIGDNGHIAFNEPGSSLGSRSRLRRLTRATMAANAGEQDGADAVPDHAVTVGIGTILESRTIVLLATGGAKADAVARMIEGPVTAMCPASALQLHPRVRVVLDQAAAARLGRSEDYADRD